MNEVPASEKNTEKRLDMLLPNFEQAEKNQKLGQSFKKEKRPELFPVKDEHKNPCSYLKKNHSALNQRNVSWVWLFYGFLFLTELIFVLILGCPE